MRLPRLLAVTAIAVTLLGAKPYVAPDPGRTVVLNTQSHKFHSPECPWAKRCEKHCVTTTLAEAKKQGGVPCKVCGGDGSDLPKPRPTPKEED